MARSVGKNTQAAHVLADPRYLAEVESNLTTGRVAVAGRDNSALAIVPAAGAVVAELAIPTDGPGVYEQVCGACHLNGLAGAPKSSDRAAWAPRIAQGTDTLYKHAIEGYSGKQGVMPAKGGRADLSDDLVKAAVDYMVAKAQ
ncbi:MAG: cytochrome c5 family protein [Gammaproteobacteria bacterium]|nr:cytochrome c5 family protein [Gammaproteobacteria bacterium]